MLTLEAWLSTSLGRRQAEGGGASSGDGTTGRDWAREEGQEKKGGGASPGGGTTGRQAAGGAG